MKYEIGNRIRMYRKESGLTQEQLADKINVTKSRVSNWEQGINRPDADILADICRALNVSPSSLLDVHLSADDLSDRERKVIQAYRNKTEVQQAVDILLGIEDNRRPRRIQGDRRYIWGESNGSPYFIYTKKIPPYNA